MIGVVSRTYWPKTKGGAEKYVYEINKRIKRETTTYTWDEINESRVHQVKIPKVRLLGSLIFSIKAARLINNNPKINYAQISQYWSEYAHFFIKKPFGCYIYDLPDNNKLLRWNVKKAALKSKVIFYISKYVSDELIKLGVPKDKLVYAPPGIDEELRSNNKYNRSKYVKNNELMFLHVSRIAPNKDLITVIEALSKLKGKINFKLFVAGAKMEWSNYYKEVQESIKAHKLEDQVKLLGSVSDEEKVALFKCADLYLHASYFGEGFGIPIVEAQATGVPVVASDLFVKTGVLRDGYNGVSFPARNPEALSKAITKIIENKTLARKIINNGKIASKPYSWNKSAEVIAKYFKEYE